MKQLEAGINQTVEWAQELRSKIKQEEAKNLNNHDQLTDSLRQLAEQVTGQLRVQHDNPGEPKVTSEMRQIIVNLQQSGLEQAEEVRSLKDRFGPELDTKLALVLRYRDEFLKRIEEVEGDVEKLKRDTNDRVSAAEAKLANGINS